MTLADDFDGRMCPGRYHGGRPLALCAVKCRRHGGNDMRAAVVVEAGFPRCENFHGFSVDAALAAEQSAEHGAPESGIGRAGPQSKGCTA